MAVYMDYNATTPLAPEVISDITQSLSEHWANPSSPHDAGVRARQVVEEARQQVATAIGDKAGDVVFTSGGTEANNMVILGSLEFYVSTGRSGTPHVVTSDTEHDAVTEPIRSLETRRLCTVTWLSCADGGRVDPAAVVDAVTPDTCLVSVMMANNETGVLNDVEEIGRRLARLPNRSHIWFHTDSAQTIGKVDVDVARIGADFVTIVGHKLYGPRVGALWTSPLGQTARPASAGGGGACVALLRGGGQERRLRPGTENTPLARGLGTACRLAAQRLQRDQAHMRQLRDLLEQRLLETGVAERINLRGSPRLPNTSSVVLAGEESGRAVLVCSCAAA
ncbi:LOW QUALITY PROTEIN: selenocysteine lyase-like [Pollicipes pollicipes]|uniref:LOW QUALITY PROTEIN: selenocysteine lyase-like n=1 Tax=Pollicipes pollicipes TaxID=41117 RepID=UPI0018859F4C|nr:LOW QUALITY PROTEIN: selenocysteine lyase-like [Pollicipes pollicipes]